MFANEKVPSLVTISFILMTLMFDSGVILLGEIRRYSLLGFKGLHCKGTSPEANKSGIKFYHSNKIFHNFKQEGIIFKSLLRI